MLFVPYHKICVAVLSVAASSSKNTESAGMSITLTVSGVIVYISPPALEFRLMVERTPLMVPVRLYSSFLEGVDKNILLSLVIFSGLMLSSLLPSTDIFSGVPPCLTAMLAAPCPTIPSLITGLPCNAAATMFP